MPYLMQGLTDCPLTCFPGYVTKAQPASADLGHNYFWCLVAEACVGIIKPCGLHNHKYNTAPGDYLYFWPWYWPWERFWPSNWFCFCDHYWRWPDDYCLLA